MRALKLGAHVDSWEDSRIQESEETANFLLTSQNAKALHSFSDKDVKIIGSWDHISIGQ